MKNLLHFLTLALLCSGVTKSAAQCEVAGYQYAGTYNGHMYYVSEADLTWEAANAAATALGGYLATISDAAENAFVADIANTWALDPDENDQGAWIGLNDVAEEGTFVWANGEPVTYMNWAVGEPNNTPYDGLGEDYVEINRRGIGTWNDLPAFVDYIEAVLEFNDADCDGLADVCDEVFDDADCDGIGDACDTTFEDADCDGIGDACDEVFNDADCDGIGDGCDASLEDADCDGIGDACDQCDGGDDSGPCDAEIFPGLSNIPADWICHANGRKVAVCHNGSTTCVDVNAVQAHLDHGDFLGPCVSCVESRSSSEFDPETRELIASGLADFAVYPNPAYGEFTISMQQHRGVIAIYDQRGQVVERMLGVEFQQLPVALPTSGVYIIQLITANEIIAKKVTVIR